MKRLLFICIIFLAMLSSGCDEQLKDYQYIGLFQSTKITDPRADHLQSDVTTSQKTVKVWGIAVGKKGDKTFESKKKIAIGLSKKNVQFLEKVK